MRQLLFVIILFFLISCESNKNNKSLKLVIGTYTRVEGHVDGHAEGIYLANFDPQAGSLTVTDTLKGVTNPSYVHAHPNHKVIYCVNEVAEDTLGGQISSFHLTSEGRWDQLSRKNTLGAYPCHIALDSEQKRIITSNYGGSVSVHKINDDGTIAEQLHSLEFPEIKKTNERQDMPHPHMALQVPKTNIFLFADLGTNVIWHYEITKKTANVLGSTPLLKGAGPRHMIFSHDNQFLFVINELNHTVEIFRIGSFSKPLDRIQILPVLPDTISQTATITSAALKLHPGGTYLYSSTRSRVNLDDNIISVMKIDSGSAKIEMIQIRKTEGLVPRDFEISPDGRFLLCAHQDSDNIIVFPIDEKTGKLGRITHRLKVNTPVCLKFL